MAGRRYVIYDVFTDTALAGNPLAVVLDADGLDERRMQAIAREFNLSETVFVTDPERQGHRARIRIFTPDYELPFAGHPTVGTAVALCELDAVGDARLVVLEEQIGDVRCAVALGAGAGFAEFDLPKLPEELDAPLDSGAIAGALGLGPHQIGFENHRPALFSAGVAYVTVPLSGLEAMGEVAFDHSVWLDLAPRRGDGNPACAYLYCRETISHDGGFHARMFVPGPPTYEDPATGSAAAAFAGTILRFDRPVDGSQQIWIEQGYEMGRPSRIRLEIEVEAGRLKTARIGGQAVRVAEGTLVF